MLAENTFKKTVAVMSQAGGFEVDADWARAVYRIMAQDFTDDNFENVCMKILRGEKFYGKPPAVEVFYRYLDQPSHEESDRIEARKIFVEALDWFSSEKMKGLDGAHLAAVRMVDAPGEVWWSVRRPDYPRSRQKVLDEIMSHYDGEARVERGREIQGPA